MNRVVVCFVLILILLSSASAQKPSPKWKTLESGVQVLRLWDSIGPKQPEIAILQLNGEKYKEFERDPKAFVDGHTIFPEKVRPEARLTQMLEAPGGYDGAWAVACFHRISHLRCASVPVEAKEPQGQEQKP